MTSGFIRPRTKAQRRVTSSAAQSWLKAIELTSRVEANRHRPFADLVDDWANRQPDRAALISDSESFTYGALASRLNAYARWALSVGLKKGDRVCLIMPTRPDYVAAWLGITRIGGVVALINTKLVGQSLAHCIRTAQPDHIIVADDLAETFETARPHLDRASEVWIHGCGGERSIDAQLAALSVGPPLPTEGRDVSIDDRALLIYTSGTTGLPKAASISHRRILNWAAWFAGLTDAAPDDRIYDCLPVYHSVGGVVAPCSMLFAGASVALADRFSATSFWQDVVRLDCTLFQYIGELCRYLLKAPVTDFESRHRLRLACGNGLRGDVWEGFQARFAIPKILEFYAATEGNFSLFNVEGKPGAIGKVPRFLAHRFPAAIIRIDRERGIPLRDETGLCVACGRDEVGEAIGRIGNPDQAGGRFEGYTDAAETDKKILRGVFAKGDAWFRTGDLMRQDGQGYFYFVDRIGDTFRWKGENVATSEVSDAIRECTGVLDAAAYGVAVAGTDGRAGMAALVIDGRFDLKHLASHLARRLPAYAHPVFVRISRAIETTETFKHKKHQLVREGFDPAVVSDPLYLRDARSGTYRPLDAATLAAVESGAIDL